MALVPHHCPTSPSHPVIEAPATALVQCGKCRSVCAPEGSDPKAHESAFWATRRKTKHGSTR